MKKYLAIILAILTFAAAFPPIVGSAADEPVPVEISARAEKELIENFDLVPGSDGNGNEYYDYDINYANPMITVKYSNGTETEKSLSDWRNEGAEFTSCPFLRRVKISGRRAVINICLPIFPSTLPAIWMSPLSKTRLTAFPRL